MHTKNVLKSIGSVLAGFITVIILSMLADLVVEGLGILPPPTQPEAIVPWMLALALAYRTVITVFGGYLTAALAPNRPMRHVIILGILGTFGGIAGTIGAWSLGNHWYPIALAVLALPSVWLGGTWRMHGRKS
jgi:hypothetical protein